jgi:myo-inositol 2-dehydrogenase / D-chiro-inositol 1-dehydrogenase
VKKLGVGVVGFDTHLYSEPFALDPRSRLVAAADETTFTSKFRDIGLPFIRRHELDFHESYMELIERDDIDIVTINTVPNLKVELVERAAQLGKHVICDKPMAHTSDAARRMREAVERAGVVFMVRYGTGYSGLSRRLREMVHAGELGDLVYVHQEILRKADIKDEQGEYYDEYFIDWVTDRGRSGGGEMINFACYALDFMRYLSGSEVVSVFARTHNAFFDLHRKKNVEDFAALSLQYGNGMSAHVIAGRSPVCRDPNRLRVLGTKGTAVAPHGGGILKDCFGREETIEIPEAGGDSAMVADFLDCIVEGKAPRTGVVEGERDVAVLEAAYASAESGQVAEL